MDKSPNCNEQKSIVAEERFIRQALKEGCGPDYLINYYTALGQPKQITFVAALVCIAHLAHIREVASK